MWREEFLGRVSDAVTAQEKWDGEKKFFGSVAKRWCSTWEHLPRPVERLINFTSRPSFIQKLEVLTGEKGLVPDPYLNGAGIHSTGQGGFLKLHADFNWHKQLRLYRRLNLLIYLNKDWDEKWGGNLDLARSADDGELVVENSVFPHFNTTVLFTTDDTSFHGQPTPMELPEGVTRNSIALYYYVAEKPETLGEEKRVGTDYRQLSGEKLNRRNPG
jgi:Rps23 Pro-64 3,4-dihydroxylase Tpa1-like proline 4-hydroxylase